MSMRDLFLLFFLFSLLSCNKKKVNNLIGDWEHKTYNGAAGIYVYNFKFKFYCDYSFTLHQEVHSSQPSNDVCKSYVYNEYVKGTFDVKRKKDVMNASI